MAGQDFGGDAEACPVVCRNGKVGCAQNGEAKAGCVSKLDLDFARQQLRRLRQEKRRRHYACGVEQFGSRPRVVVLKTASHQNLAVWEQSGNMVLAPLTKGNVGDHFPATGS